VKKIRIQKFTNKTKFFIPTLLLSLTLLFCLSVVSAADNSTIYVNGTGGNDANNGTSWDYAKKTIQNAIDTAQDNSTVNVDSGIYYENLKIKKNLNLIGAGKDSTSINGGRKGSCIEIVKGVSVIITGFNIRYGGASYGGGINNYGTLTLRNSTVNDNRALVGGGIANRGTLYLENSEISYNTANYGSGIANLKGTMILENSQITDNDKAEFGTQIFTTGTVYANNTVIGNTIYYNDGPTSYINQGIGDVPNDVFGRINDQFGGVQVPDSASASGSHEQIAMAAVSTKKTSNYVEMHETGLPANYLILAVLMVLGGLLVPKRE